MIELIQGDCLEKIQDIPDGSVDMVLADPPYNTTECKWDMQPLPWEAIWPELWRIMGHHGVIAVTAQPPFSFKIGSMFSKDYRHRFLWEKDKCANFQTVRAQPLKYIEEVLIFSRAGFLRPWNDGGTIKSTYNPQMREGSGGSRDKRIGVREPKSKHLNEISPRKSYKANTKMNTNDSSKQRYPRDRINFPVPFGKTRAHPTEKPVALMEYLIKTYTNEGCTVLDFAMGSGTTGVACRNLNRSFIGIELDAKYFQIARDRISAV